MIGLGMFALPTAILGAGFAYELQKRSFAATAAMVARVPMFRHLPPASSPSSRPCCGRACYPRATP